MKDYKHLDWPGYKQGDMVGRYYIQPLKQRTARGYHWTWELTFELERFIAEAFKETFVLRHWGKPKVELTKVEITDKNGKTCQCVSCKQGRKDVAKGWLPK